MGSNSRPNMNRDDDEEVSHSYSDPETASGRQPALPPSGGARHTYGDPVKAGEVPQPKPESPGFTYGDPAADGGRASSVGPDLSVGDSANAASEDGVDGVKTPKAAMVPPESEEEFPAAIEEEPIVEEPKAGQKPKDGAHKRDVRRNPDGSRRREKRS